MRRRALDEGEISLLIVLGAFLLGGWFRIMPAWLAGFPVNDGGMFYTMIQDLQASRYALPLFTAYNNLHIPYIYPPLGFYAGAAITGLLELSTPLAVIRWLPGLLNALTIPAFYLLAKEITGNRFHGALSTLVFAFIPHMTAWLSMGGGLTRAPGMLFMLLALTFIHRVFTADAGSGIWGAVIFGGLTVLSHTEATLYMMALGIYIWAMKSRSARGLIHGIVIAAGALILASPWLFTVIARHGITPFISAGATSLRDSWSVLRLVNIDFFTEEPYLDLFGAAGVLGLALLAARREFFLPGMFLVIALVNPRSAHTVGNIPLSMAAAWFVLYFLKPYLITGNDGEKNRKPVNAAILSAILIPFIFGNMLYYETLLAERHVSLAERDAFQWIKENTPANRAFLVITGETNGFCDSVSEWFPALTGRRSAATLQGNEWIRGNNFGEFIADTQALQSCANKGLECILRESKRFESDFDYLYVSLNPPTSDCEPTDASSLTRSLVAELGQSPQFEPVLISEAAAVFKKK